MIRAARLTERPKKSSSRLFDAHVNTTADPQRDIACCGGIGDAPLQRERRQDGIQRVFERRVNAVTKGPHHLAAMAFDGRA